MDLSIHIRQLKTPTTVLVKDLRMDIPKGRIATLMGASGSGKSSVLSAIAGTLSQGLVVDCEVRLNNVRVDSLPTHQRHIGLLFQDDLLFAHMTVAENLLFAIPASNQPSERLAKVAQALEEAGLADMGQRDPATLSGGQRARVALMRALLAQPQALLLDEPFSKLDTKLREQFRTFVFTHIRKRGIPALLVSHDELDIADSALLFHLPALDRVTNDFNKESQHHA